MRKLETDPIPIDVNTWEDDVYHPGLGRRRAMCDIESTLETMNVVLPGLMGIDVVENFFDQEVNVVSLQNISLEASVDGEEKKLL